jgi:glycogen(starch) synthase
MNILYICDEYPPGRHGGIGTAVQLLAREMVKQGHTVVVAGFYDWGYGGEDKLTDEGVLVYRFRRKLATRFLGNLKKLPVRILYKALTVSGLFEWDIRKSINLYNDFLLKLIEKYNIEIAEIPDYLDYIRFCKSYLAFPELPIPTVVRLHGSYTYFEKEAGKDVPEFAWQMDHDLLEGATAVCSVSKYTAEKTALYLNYKKPMQVIYNGIDTDNFPAPVKKKPYKAVFTGTLIEKKGIYSLLQAWNIVHEKLNNAELWIYGKGPVEKLKAILSDKAIRSVFFKGHVPRQELLYSLADASLAVFPSFAETFGLAALEAMACGTAVIFTERTSGPEIINDEVNGILVDPANVQEIADNIIDLLDNVYKCEQIALAGKHRVNEKFNISHIAMQHAVYYETILGRHE